MKLRRSLRQILLVGVPFVCLLIGAVVVQPVLPKTSALTRSNSTLIVQERASNLPIKFVVLCNAPLEDDVRNFSIESGCAIVH